MNYGPRQMARARLDDEIDQMHREANAHLTQILRRDFPDHQHHFHLMHRGITYAFHSHRSVVTGNNLPRGSANWSASIIRDELEERDEEPEDQLFQFHLRDGSLSVKIQVYHLNEPVGLQDLPAATRLYRALYYYRSENPIHATVTVVTQSPLQVLGMNNGPIH